MWWKLLLKLCVVMKKKLSLSQFPKSTCNPITPLQACVSCRREAASRNKYLAIIIILHIIGTSTRRITRRKHIMPFMQLIMPDVRLIINNNNNEHEQYPDHPRWS